MKKTFLSLVLMIASFWTVAQSREPGHAMATRMKAELALSDAQFEQIKKINAKFAEDQVQLRRDTARSKNLRTERRQIIEEREENVRKVLTEEQYSKWTEVRKTSRDNRPRDGFAGNRVEELKKALGISDEQARKMMAIDRNMVRNFSRMRTDTIDSREGRDAAVKTIVDQRNSEIRKILSEAQYAKFLEFEAKKKRQRRGVAR